VGADCSQTVPTAGPTPNPTGPTDEPTDIPCFNGGLYCNGNGNCVNGKCNCTAPDALQPDCAISPPPLPKCDDMFKNVSVPDCDTCLANSKAIGLVCSYCPPPNATNNNQFNLNPLLGGTCQQVCIGEALRTCQPPVEVIPPVCPDNCSDNGVCVNLTECARLEKENKLKYGNDTGLYPLSCGQNLNTSKKYNQTGACACFQGFVGLNCAIIGRKTLVALAALGAGIIALIVVLAILGAACAGGGAAAVSSGVAQGSDGTVINSPLYQANAGSADNPLYCEAYEML